MKPTISVESLNLAKRDIAALRERIDRTYDLLSGIIGGGGSGGSLHDPVTLSSAEIQAVLDLVGQSLDLDTQAANEIFAGPATGGDVKPAFRSLVAADIPPIGEGPGIDIVGRTVGLGLDSVLLSHGNGTPAAEYTTLALAIAAAGAGDTIWLPPGTYPDDHTIPDGATVAAFASLTAVLTGQITLGNNGLGADDPPGLSGLRVNRTANDGNILKGVIAPATGGCRIVRTFVSCIQSGAGHAYAVSVEDAGDLETLFCMLYAEAGGTPYAGYRTGSANLYVINTPVPMAAPFSE